MQRCRTPSGSPAKGGKTRAARMPACFLDSILWKAKLYIRGLPRRSGCRLPTPSLCFRCILKLPSSLGVSMPIRSVALTALTLALLASRALSQQLPPTFPVVHDDIARVVSAPVQAPGEPGIHSPLLAAAGLGILGWGVGAIAVHSMHRDCFEEFCDFEGIFYGGAAGGGLGLALG